MSAQRDMKHQAQSIYIHIPFCKSKCPYCDFASWANKEDLIEKYFDALLHEIQTKCEVYSSHGSTQPSIKTIFLGGGTPSLIHPDLYKKLFNELKKYFLLEKNCEVTLELNPGTAKEDYLNGYKKLGINRISIGAQSFNENILKTLGRGHSIQDTIFAINKTRESGFENFNLDFIYAVPGMTKEIWKDTILEALKFEPKHISAYSLTIEQNTPFKKIYKKPPLDDDSTFELYIYLCNVLKEAGFIHYEISNFAKPGFESKHNLTYWLQEEYFAFGINAHRYLNGLRSSNLRELEKYIENPNHEIILDFGTSHDFEKLMLNSRLMHGFDINTACKISNKSQPEIRALLNRLRQEGYVELSNDKVHLTDKGMFVNNEILLQLI